jgi:hypothetical protein
MSEAAFQEAHDAAENEEDLEVEAPEVVEEEGEVQAKEPDWQKQAHDKAGQAAKERSRRRAAEREVADLRARFEKLEAAGKGGEDQLEKLAAQLRDDDEDPITDLATAKAIIKQFINARKTEHEQTEAQTSQQRQAQELINTMADYEADFTADHPDYQDAAKHYRAERQAELEEQGYSGPELQAALARDLFGIVQRALQAGRDPAEATYNLAKKRGFKGGEDTTTAKLEKIAGAAAAGVRPGGGKVGGGALTWGAVAAMKGADRDKAFAKLREQERRAG